MNRDRIMSLSVFCSHRHGGSRKAGTWRSGRSYLIDSICCWSWTLRLQILRMEKNTLKSLDLVLSSFPCDSMRSFIITGCLREKFILEARWGLVRRIIFVHKCKSRESRIHVPNSNSTFRPYKWNLDTTQERASLVYNIHIYKAMSAEAFKLLSTWVDLQNV